jgi:hypothetical protein
MPDNKPKAGEKRRFTGWAQLYKTFGKENYCGFAVVAVVGDFVL